MSVASPTQTIDELTERARAALAKSRCFEAETIANEALHLARHERDFQRMARIVPPLLEARHQRLAPALDAGTITIVDTPFTDEVHIEPGCYLVQPPLVAADARRLRLAALSREVSVAVLTREPIVRVGLCPIVAISSGATVRTKIDPPDDPDRPDLDWYLDAMDALGEWALETLDPDADVEKRIDALLARLDAIPDHEGLHQCLEEACREAHDLLSADPSANEDKP
jgi:hypothetical protein